MQVYEIRGSFGLQSLLRAERPEPTPGPGQVLLRIRAVSLNYRDLLMVKGIYNPRLKLPRIPVSDAVAEVAAVGQGVSSVKVGERVCPCFMPKWLDGQLTQEAAESALGGDKDGLLAEYSVLSQEGMVPVPDYLTDEEAATLPCAGVTAYHALALAQEQMQTVDNQTVLVQGTGGVALWALQLAHALGKRVIITSSSEAKLKRAMEMGASVGLNYKANPEWGVEARKKTDNDRGVDHIIELGGAGTLPQSLRAARLGGRISLIGVLSGTQATFNPMLILMKGICVQGIFVGSRRHLEGLCRLLEEKKIHPVIDRVFPFAEASEALQHLESGSHFGKIVIRLS